MNIEREKELYKQMDLLQMKEVSTYRQQKNGTRIFELPIKMYGQYIKVGSFESGYVRRMNGCYTPYQLNKCEPHAEFHKEWRWNSQATEQYFTGKYNKFVGKRRILIPNEVDRLEYLMTYCLKNYYINQANEIENGKFIPKWRHEYEMKNGNIDTVRELQSENRRLHNIYLKQTNEATKYEKTIRELHEEIDRISENHDEMESKFLEGQLQNLSVIVNNQKYKII